jgi:hypothetical protein
MGETRPKTDEEKEKDWIMGIGEPEKKAHQPVRSLTAAERQQAEIDDYERRKTESWIKGEPVPPKARKPSKEKPESEWKPMGEPGWEYEVPREENPYLRAIAEFEEKQKKERELKKAREEFEKLNKKAG